VRATETVAAAVALSLLIGSAGCGKKGPLLMPLSKVPSAPADVTPVQRGETVILTWTNPTTYIDGHALDGVSAVEVWLLQEGMEAGRTEPPLPKPEEFASRSRRIVRIPWERPSADQGRATAAVGSYDYPLPDGVPLGTRFIFGLKASDARRRLSDFSALAVFRSRALPRPPAGLRAVVGNEAVELNWEPARENIDRSIPAGVKGYNLYRSLNGAPAVRINTSLVTDTRFADTTFAFDSDTVYTVRAAAAAAEPFGESSDSEACRLRPEDTFPPAAPSGLLSMAGPDFISLTWDGGTERDLAGYRVWRRAEGAEDYLELTSGVIKETAFQDSTAERGRRFEYAVTAEDMKGNRSGRSAPVRDEIKGERP